MSRFEKEIGVSDNGSYPVQARPNQLPAMFIPPQIQRQQQTRMLQPPGFPPLGQLPPRPMMPTAAAAGLPPPSFLPGHPAALIRPPPPPIVNAPPAAFKPMVHHQPFAMQPPPSAGPAAIIQSNPAVKTFKPASYTVTPMGLPTNVHSVSNPVQPSSASSKKQKTNAAGTAAASNTGEKKNKKQKKIVRVAGGQTWEDATLQEWDPDDFRIFCGDLGNDVNEDILTRAFNKYPSFVKCKVIRDKRTNKSKGYGFISFKEPSDFIRAMRDMDGKYVGSRPIKLRRSNWRDRNIEVVKKKIKEKQKLGLI